MLNIARRCSFPYWWNINKDWSHNVADPAQEAATTANNYVEPRLVLVAQDEMMAQGNDGKTKSCVLDGEQPLRKKGAGHGIHQSDVFCSTVGWLKDASQRLEYGKIMKVIGLECSSSNRYVLQSSSNNNPLTFMNSCMRRLS